MADKHKIQQRLEQLVQIEFDAGTLHYLDRANQEDAVLRDGRVARIQTVQYEVEITDDLDAEYRTIYVPLDELVRLYDQAAADVESGAIEIAMDFAEDTNYDPFGDEVGA